MSDRYIAKTFYGLETVLADEIRSLGGDRVEELNRAVAFDGNLKTMYKANLHCRTALRILQPILEFSAHNETVLYKRLRRYPWWETFAIDQTFAVDATVHSSLFTHSHYVALKTKDAIVDLFRHKFNNRRPSVDVTDPDIRINVHCRETKFTISLDTSGESLHRRGYRSKSAKAPLNEALAAGLILLSGWDLKTPLYDPMCGSGTLIMEAALLLHNQPPRLHRTDYAFKRWQNYDDSLFRKVRNEAISGILKAPSLRIHGTEKEKREVIGIRNQLKDLGLDQVVDLNVGDFFTSTPPANEGLIITNPPYGHRLEQKNIGQFYRQIGDCLKSSFDGWQAWILSGNKEALKSIGLRTSKRMTLFNGPLECKFHRYDLYKGSLKSQTSP